MEVTWWMVVYIWGYECRALKQVLVDHCPHLQHSFLSASNIASLTAFVFSVPIEVVAWQTANAHARTADAEECFLQ